MSGAFRVLLIVLTGLCYIIAHEFGHYAMAADYSLDPTFVYGNGAGSNMLGMALGVSHLATSQSQNFFVIFGATLLPLAIGVVLAGAALLRDNEELALMAEVFFLLTLINLVPIPGMSSLDANKIWSYILL